jgi:hypothetical protein
VFSLAQEYALQPGLPKQLSPFMPRAERLKKKAMNPKAVYRLFPYCGAPITFCTPLDYLAASQISTTSSGDEKHMTPLIVNSPPFAYILPTANQPTPAHMHQRCNSTRD